MFRIRRVYDNVIPKNKEALRQVGDIMRSNFSSVPESEIQSFGEKIRDPFKQRFLVILFVSENSKKQVTGFAILLHEPQLRFCYLDYIASAKGRTGGGLGTALYQQVRDEASAIGAEGLFYECLPDDAALCADSAILKENASRLRFYEGFGARPIVNTAYETPLNPGDTCPPYLVYDSLEPGRPLSRDFARKVARVVLERKYGHICPPEYIKKVVNSFNDDPVLLRDPKYKKAAVVKESSKIRPCELITLVVSDQHEIHHIRERGYVESPVRIASILSELEPSGYFERMQPREFPDKHILAVHDSQFVNYIRRACEESPEGKSIYPYVFPIRNKTRPPKEPNALPGYYCIDTFTPINRQAYIAARRAANCVLTAAQEILMGKRLSYALVRPPGHHAERSTFGGFCYLNNTAIAAQYIVPFGRVAILDIDYHHGNGQQDIFYNRSDVFTVSIHGHPRFAYPYFTGFDDESGEGSGEKYNLNIPLPESVDGERYRKELDRALKKIADFGPDFLVVAFGLDTAKGDPTGTWSLLAGDFEANGRMIAEMDLPTLLIQEGGYRNRTIGINARRFFKGLAEATRSTPGARRIPLRKQVGVSFRYDVMPEDSVRIPEIVKATGFFNDDEVAVAKELVDECLARGSEKSGYYFVFAESQGETVGYSCYGPVAGTLSSFDVYWIAVHPDFQSRGLGLAILRETEKHIRAAGGTRFYVETSSRPQYDGTRAFYERCGYKRVSILEDFYAPGDGKATFCKTVRPQKSQGRK